MLVAASSGVFLKKAGDGDVKDAELRFREPLAAIGHREAGSHIKLECALLPVRRALICTVFRYRLCPENAYEHVGNNSQGDFGATPPGLSHGEAGWAAGAATGARVSLEVGFQSCIRFS